MDDISATCNCKGEGDYIILSTVEIFVGDNGIISYNTITIILVVCLLHVECRQRQ